jgi:hypothetical protein
VGTRSSYRYVAGRSLSEPADRKPYLSAHFGMPSEDLAGRDEKKARGRLEVKAVEGKERHPNPRLVTLKTMAAVPSLQLAILTAVRDVGKG